MLQRLPKRSGRQRKKLAQVARLWACGQLDNEQDDTTHEAQQTTVDNALAAFGLCSDASHADAEEGAGAANTSRVCYLWPCNIHAWNIWLQVQTQWRVSSGMDGERKTGLDYGGVLVYLFDVLGVPRGKKGNPGQWRGTNIDEIWQGLQAMEIAALNAWTEQRNARQAG